MGKKIYVIDTSTLVYFYSDLKSPNILYLLFQDGLKIVPQVEKELLKLGKEKGFYNEVIADISRGFLQIEEVDIYNKRVRDFLVKFKRRLDIGERFSAALALERGYELLIDDWVAQQEMMFGLVGLTYKNAEWVLDYARKKRRIVEKEYRRLKNKLYNAKRRYFKK